MSRTITCLLRVAIGPLGLALALATSATFAARPEEHADTGKHEQGAAQKPAGGAAALVQAALDAEQAGDRATRAKLLSQAVAADPEFAPARWHSGHVKFDGQWRTPEEVQQLVANHERWIDYRALREGLSDSPDDHLTLAQYCQEHGLSAEGRYHWANVLLAAPDHKAARAALQIVPYRRGLFTKAQVAALEDEARAARENFSRLQPQMIALCRAATSSGETERAAAIAKIRALDDPEVLDALQLAVDKAAAKTPRFSQDLYLALVAAMSNMPQHDATLRLLNYAVFAENPEVRQLAAESLRVRPQTDYVPLLMAALRAPIDVETDVVALPDGTVRLVETITQERPQGDRQHVRSTNYETSGALNFDRTRSNPALVLETHLGSAEAIASRTQLEAETLNELTAERNARIQDVLRIATGSEQEAPATAWWKEWMEYNELVSTQFASEEATTYEVNTREYHYPQAPIYVEPSRESSKGSLSPRPEGPRRGRFAGVQTIQRRGEAPFTRNLYLSCFVAGTPVWTTTGPKPIEDIAPGDLVLAQHPATGELDYRPVLQLTVGEPTGVVNLQVGGETIGATLGHRFWVVGRGWQMAKFLEPGTELHSLNGSAELTQVAPADKVQAYNLVVDEFHTYFVGTSKLLVHDLGCPQPVICALPGSARLQKNRPLDPPMEFPLLGAGN